MAYFGMAFNENTPYLVVEWEKKTNKQTVIITWESQLVTSIENKSQIGLIIYV